MDGQVFIDTNVFLIFLTKHRDNWQKIGDIFDSEKHELKTSVLVINELKYKLLWTAAAEKLNTQNKYEIIDFIKNDKNLRDGVYSKFLEFYTNIKQKIAILDITDKDEIASCQLSDKYGLLPTDASIAASMISNGIKKILTDDADFKKVKELEVMGI